MRDFGFFEGVPHPTVAWSGGETHNPVFYYDFAQLAVVLATPLERIRELLPAPWLHPLRLGPRSGVTVIAAYQYRDCDLGPYNEVLIGFPVEVHRRAPLLLGLRRFSQSGGAIWIWQLPVTTIIARDLGVEVAGYPKFLADVDFEADGSTVACRLREGGRDILSLRFVHRAPRPVAARRRIEPITVKDGRVLFARAVMNVPEAVQSYGGRRVEVLLGDHHLADRLRGLGLGRVVAASYEPCTQSILSAPLESWAPTGH